MKILVVKLSDIGDVLTATPALRALRQSFAQAHISVLLPPNSAGVLQGSPLVDRLLVFDKFRFDSAIQAFKPLNLAYGAGLFQRLTSEAFDTVIILHHLTTLWGVAKYAALTSASKAKRRVGLDNGRGWFLTDTAKDYGFGGKHEVKYWLDVVGLLGARTEDTRLEIPIFPEDEAFARQVLAGHRRRTLIAVHPGSGEYSKLRRWPLGSFAEVTQELTSRDDAQVVLLGGKEEIGLGEILASQIAPPPINLTGKTTIRQLAAVLKRCKLFIGNDSGVMHIAAAVGTPLVAIFGPSNHRAWRPWCSHATVLRADLSCSPCLYVGNTVGKRQDCKDLRCMKLITPATVLEAARKALGDNV